MALAEGLLGAVVYVVDFLILAPTVVTQFLGPNDPLELAAHVVFGHVLATFFYSAGVRSGEPILSFGSFGRS